MAERYLIMLAVDAAALQAAMDNKQPPKLEALAMYLGRPLIERAGVASRRVIWAHAFPFWAAQPDGVRLVRFDDDGRGITPPAAVNMQLTSTFPANWRGPLTSI